MRILFAGGGTGGHLYPGLAIARAVQRLEPAAEPFFIGARRGIERDVLPEAGFPFALLELHPLYRQRPWENWRTLRGLGDAWRRIGGLARQRPPAAVVGTGGYAAGAVLAYAARHGIPYAIQEQNSFAGLTVRVFSRWARELYLGFPEAVASLPPAARARALDTGNPIEPPPARRPARAEARARWALPPEVGTVLLVFGGSQGARALNEAVAGWVAEGLPEGLGLIWGTGKGSFDAYARLESPRVRVRAYLSPIAEAYAAADLALTRAGAMTTAELCAWGLPAVLVPLPTAAADHQSANARALAAAGAAVHLPQAELSAAALTRTVQALRGDPPRLARMTAAATARARPDAAERIARHVLALAAVPRALS
ncbi:MAG TPA: UDP-N-acetylglucosamine--N-acetylmuramyl-(pentapeptide) pyrophosphoryl-undecaprenol N-acetylglucosamine transferase [Gemmatimonadaceae bacterium]|nr:UDP-N-acetylglucosamine--N-acetylmuramyl-(pentapeptide) pyrophosphoryl-undecaprenol N-acetylglucosamine transferase [Gemmatimonadaceae bacterium]